MSGRAYTMKEMKQIVDYLVEHRAYSEIGGRKMWMDLANSRIINRTWQSLKETFNKRILTDIHNPYYKLTTEQICSFRQKRDLAKNNGNRLEIRTDSNASNTSDNQRANMQEAIMITENVQENTGEKNNRSRSSSTETLVLETFYKSAADVQRELESPVKMTTQKSVRECITYSEPLTPMLQEVLHDFVSDDEPQLQIDEEPETHTNPEKSTKSTSPETIRESRSYTKKTNHVQKGEERNQQASKIKSLKLKKTQKGTWENKELVNDVSCAVQSKETNNNESEMAFSGNKDTAITGKNESNNVVKSIDNNDTNATNDTPLPNNQEELTDKAKQSRSSLESSNTELLDPHKKNKEKSRKRSHSQSSVERKNKKEKRRDNSEAREQEKDTQTFDSHPQATSLQNNLVNDTSVTDGTVIPPNVAVADNTKSTEGTSQVAGPSDINTANPAELNPCLTTVSLLEEEFSQAKYSDSDDAVQNDTQIKNILPTKDSDQESGQKSKHDNEKSNNDNVKSNETNTSNKSKEIAKNNYSNNTEMPTTSKNTDGILLLHSHTDDDDTSSDFENSKAKNSVIRYKKSALGLANIFGFSSGGVTRKRLSHSKTKLRHFKQRRRLNSRNNTYSVESVSSGDYSTVSDGEDEILIDPLNGRRRKYNKPTPYDLIYHDNSEFVVGKRKLYPLLLAGSGSIHHAAGSGQADGQSDSYWKAKYLEEKKKLDEEKKKHAEEKIRADELARLLRQTQEKLAENEPMSPILQPNLSTTVNRQEQKKPKTDTEKDTNANHHMKIKIVRNGQEIEVVGPPSNINSIFAGIFETLTKNDEQEAADSKQDADAEVHKNINAQDAARSKQVTDTETIEQKSKTSLNNDEKAKQTNSFETLKVKKQVPQKSTRKTNLKEQSIKMKDSDSEVNNKPVETVELSSRSVTPVDNMIDPETHKKVDDIEAPIFEKIADTAKTDENSHETSSNAPSDDINVTKRKRGRPKKVNTYSPPLLAESIETASQEVPALSVEGGAKRTRSRSVAAVERAGKRARTLSVGANVADVEVKRASRPPRKYGSDANVTVQPKAPRPKRSKSKVSLSRADAANKDERATPEDEEVRYKLPNKAKKNTRSAKRTYSADESRVQLTSPNISMLETTQGYQDSDFSPPLINTRKKRTMNLVVKKGQLKRIRKKSCPYLADDDSCSTTESHKSSGATHASQTLNSDVYRSESYQILMPKAKPAKQSLHKIDENSTQQETEADYNLDNRTPLTIRVNNEYYVGAEDTPNKLCVPRGSEPNSSNISLPGSPELSVVENLSVSKDLISSSLEDRPSLNEIQGNNERSTIANKYLISDVDVTMPLMGQQCDLQSQRNKPNKRRATFSESLEQAQFSSETLNEKLRDLLLESAKKMSEANAMDIDPIVPSEKKTRAKRRSSTPRKKLTVKKLKTPEVGAVIEEHTESCSHSGRKSCPPIIQVIPCEEEVTKDPNINNATAPSVSNRGRKKKDVIKVKIVRPRDKSGSKDRTHKSRLTACTVIDSGNNDESGVFDGCLCCDISTELIHNHSDTCLQEDCAADSSVEFVENMAKSVISVSSNSLNLEINETRMNKQDTNKEMLSQEMFCSNARDATNLNSAKRPIIIEMGSEDAVSVYHTPPSAQSFNSLITDDLSEEGKPAAPEWYILSEDETNFVDARSQLSNASVGSNLNQIFTPFAIPDLSTITEMSKENDTRNVNVDNDADSVPPSIFDPDF